MPRPPKDEDDVGTVLLPSCQSRRLLIQPMVCMNTRSILAIVVFAAMTDGQIDVAKIEAARRS